MPDHQPKVLHSQTHPSGLADTDDAAWLHHHEVAYAHPGTDGVCASDYAIVATCPIR